MLSGFPYRHLRPSICFVWRGNESNKTSVRSDPSVIVSGDELKELSSAGKYVVNSIEESQLK